MHVKILHKLAFFLRWPDFEGSGVHAPSYGSSYYCRWEDSSPDKAKIFPDISTSVTLSLGLEIGLSRLIHFKMYELKVRRIRP